ncbi:RlpA-like double-psi beta-barrel domain-containing protein [Tunturiibacter empetritectus]
MFDMNEMTAAHKTLPFGSKVKVTDLRNQRSVVVTITDRGRCFRAG